VLAGAGDLAREHCRESASRRAPVAEHAGLHVRQRQPPPVGVARPELLRRPRIEQQLALRGRSRGHLATHEEQSAPSSRRRKTLQHRVRHPLDWQGAHPTAGSRRQTVTASIRGRFCPPACRPPPRSAGWTSHDLRRQVRRWSACVLMRQSALGPVSRIQRRRAAHRRSRSCRCSARRPSRCG